MDNENFEQQFAQSVKAAPPPSSTPKESKINVRILLIITGILAVVVLVESFALTITLSSYFGVFDTVDSAEVDEDED